MTTNRWTRLLAVATLLSTTLLPLQASAQATVTETRSYVYDQYQRLCKTINPESGATVVDYDADGKIAWTAEGQNLPSSSCDRDLVPESQRLRRQYDAMDRIALQATPDGSADITTAYLADGQVWTLSATNAGGDPVTTTYTYNKRRMPVSEKLVDGTSSMQLGYGYDANGFQSSVTYPDGQQVLFTPDGLGRATEVRAAAGMVYAANIAYHPGGAIKSFAYGNGVAHAMIQNTRRLPARSTDSFAGTPILDDLYAFDPNGNVTDITDNARAGYTTRGMGYDALDRLTTVVAPQLWGNAIYEYDALDNIRRADVGARMYRYVYNPTTWRLDAVTTPTDVGIFSLQYDARGNQIRKNANDYLFDAAKRLTMVKGVQSYRYDGLGRRSKTTDVDGKTTFWIYSQPGQVLYTSEARRSQNLSYIYLGNTQVATRAVAWGTGAVTVKYQHTDSLGSPVAETSANGSVLSRNVYEPYGGAWGTPAIDGTGYTGHVMDRDTGLTYMQQRYYDAALGRFASLDPVATQANDGENFNRYWYANNTPYKFTDPDGRSVVTKLIKLAIKGGDVAATVSGILDDVGTLRNPNASVGSKLLAGASLLSEVVSPVSIGDAKDVVKGAAKLADKVGDVVHGNSKLSTRLQHRYEIVDNRTGEVAKTGISGRALNANGSSGRANSQVNALNRAEGEGTYSARVVETNLPGRQAALDAESAGTLRLREAGNELPLQRRP